MKLRHLKQLLLKLQQQNLSIFNINTYNQIKLIIMYTKAQIVNTCQ